jgi:hypothetical protein
MLKAVGLKRAQESDAAVSHALTVAFGVKVTCTFHVDFYQENKTVIERVRAHRANTQFGGKHESEKQKGGRYGGKVMSEKQKKQRDYSSEPSERTRRRVDSAPVARKIWGGNTLPDLRKTAIFLRVLISRNPDNVLFQERLVAIQAEIEAAEK